MDPISDKGLARRDLFAATARYAAAGGIVVLSAGLVVKGFLLPEDARCSVSAGCRDCRAAADCGLPAAVQFRSGKQSPFSRAACGPGALPNDPATSGRAKQL